MTHTRGSRSPKRKARSGQAIVVIALTMILLLILTVVGIDGSRLYSMRRVAQNAADEAVLAGDYYLARNLSLTTSPTVAQVLTVIDSSAEANQVPDPDGIPNDGVNANIVVDWLILDTCSNTSIDQGPLPNPLFTDPEEPCDVRDSQEAGDNDPLAPITGSYKFNAAPFTQYPIAGLKVTVTIPFTGFLSQFLGQSGLSAQASAQGRINIQANNALTVQNFNGGSAAVWVGGGSTCNGINIPIGGNQSDQIAFDYVNSQNARFLGPVTVNGSLNVISANNPEFDGNFHVFGNYAPSTTGVSPPTVASNPFPGTTQWGPGGGPATNFYGTTPNTAFPDSDPRSWPPLYWNSDGSRLDASYFSPGSNYAIYLGASKYHSFTAGTKGASVAALTTSGTSTYTNNNTLVQTINSDITSLGYTGVFYIDGDLAINPGFAAATWNNVTIVTSGRFVMNDNNHTIGSSVYGDNLSVLAGLDLSTQTGYIASDRCASDGTDYTSPDGDDAVFEVTGGNNIFLNGIVYVPYGQFYVSGNTNSSSVQFSGGIVAYSVRFGDNGNQAQNWHFNFNSALYNRYYPSTQLMGN